MVVWAVGFLEFNCGYGTGVTSPMIGQLTGLYLDEDTAAWFASSLVIGQVLGSLLGGGLANRIGRKKTCVLAAVGSTVGWAVLAASQSFWMLILGRIITGFFDCLSVAGGYMYVAEVTDTKLRGSFVNSLIVFCGLGIAFGYMFGSTLLWRFSCFVAMTVNLLAILILFFCLETPAFFLMNHKAMQYLYYDNNLKTNFKIYFKVPRLQLSILETIVNPLPAGSVRKDSTSQQEIKQQLKEMEAAASVSMTLQDTVTKLQQGSNLRPFLIVMTLFVFYPICGVYNISFFAVSLFTKLGLGGAETVAVFTALMRCLGTCCSSFLLLRSGYTRVCNS